MLEVLRVQDLDNFDFSPMLLLMYLYVCISVYSKTCVK